MQKRNAIKEEATPGCYIKARHSLLLLQFIGMVGFQFIRHNISIAIVAMVNTTSYHDDVNATNHFSCPDRDVSTARTENNGVFHWNRAEQGLLLGCYFYGYTAVSIPVSWVSKRFGIKYTVGISSLVASVLTICTPFVAYYSFELLVVVRVLIGAFQGINIPAMLGSWGVWAPVAERSFLVSFVLSGNSAGSFLNLFLSGFIAEDRGWEAVFYFSGGWYFVWSVLWIALAHNTPVEHPRISKQELNYIDATSNHDNEDNELDWHLNWKLKEAIIPWKSILTSMPLLAICVASFTSNWGSHAIQSMLPTYLATVLHFNVSASGLLSAFPEIIKWILTMLSGYLTGLAQRKTAMSVGTLRKMNQTISLLVSSLFLVLAGYVGCNVEAAVAFFCLSVGFSAFTVPGSLANTVDIAPRFAGILFGIINTIANIPGFLAPQVIGLILFDNNSLSHWQIVFWIAAGVSITGATFYLVFASGEVQPWAKVVLLDSDVNTKVSSEDCYPIILNNVEEARYAR